MLLCEQELETAYVMPTFGRKPVEFVRGKGMHLWDDVGTEYLDFLSGIGVVSLGHCHPAVVEAISGQAKKLMHVGNYYYVERRGKVAQTLSALLNEVDPKNATVWQSFFANSGAEANECAIKLARLWANKQGKEAQNVLTLEKSFHGRTLATLAATAQPAKQESFQPLPSGFIHTPLNDVAALEDVFEQHGKGLCAVMIECIQGESGVHPASQEFLEALEHLAKEHQVLIICDEIQTGIYRCGAHPFAFQHYGLQPDIVTIAKGVASGFPAGVCAAKKEIAAAFEPGDHGSTFGGSCLAIAAIDATLTTLQSLEISSHVERMGLFLRESLKKSTFIVEVRGLGLMCGCDLADGLSAPRVVDEMLERGFLVNATGSSTLRFLPPLICEADDITVMVATLEEVIGGL